MGRPKHDPNIPTARDRLVRAFWDLLSERPYAQITVTELSNMAGVNKNTFYYHFDDIDTMAERIVIEEFRPEALKSLVRKLTQGATEARDPELEISFERLCVVCSPNSSSVLRMSLKNALRTVWAEMLGLELERLPVQGRLSFEFAVGGVIGVLEYRSSEAKDLSFTDVLTAEPQEHLDALKKARLEALGEAHT